MTEDRIVAMQRLLAFVVKSYAHTAYRIRGFGRLPSVRAPRIVVANHQHDLDSVAVPPDLVAQVRGSYAIRWVATRRNFEPGFMAWQYPLLEPLLRRSNWGDFYGLLGMMPIENHVRERAIGNLAWSVGRRHGDLPLAAVFDDETIALLGATPQTPLSDLSTGRYFRRAYTRKIAVATLREPYAEEVVRETRDGIARDFMQIEAALRDGQTIFLTPEGGYNSDGRMGRMRGSLERLRPFGDVVLSAISYDPFRGSKLSLLYRLVPPADQDDLESSLRAARPITVSQLLADGLRSGEGAREQSVVDRLQQLDPAAFVDPELRERPRELAREAAARAARIGVRHPHFPHVTDIVAHQANTFAQTVEALRRLRERGHFLDGAPSRG